MMVLSMGIEPTTLGHGTSINSTKSLMMLTPTNPMVVLNLLENSQSPGQGAGQNEIGLAEFAKARGIAGEPVFAWWVPHTLMRRNAPFCREGKGEGESHKYGIGIPTSLVQAKELS
jgi:hypothetical protein